MKIPSLLAALAFVSASRLAGDVTQLQQSFIAPPDDAKPMVRWWWFGPSVVKPQLEREMNFMKEGGFGGFEVQPTYPLAVDGQYPNVRNYQFLSPEFFDMLGFTAGKAKDLGLRMDLTLGSGWPYGGPMFTRDEAVQNLAQSAPVQVTAGQTSVPVPAGGGRGARGNASPTPVAAALLGPIANPAPGASPYIPLKVVDGAAQLPADLQGASQVVFYTSPLAGLQQVKRPALGAEGFIIDHYGPAAIAKFIKEIAEPEIKATGTNPPYAVFCDSLEVAGEGWTPTFLAEFKQRRGYDLEPLLPALFDNNWPRAAEIRADYGKTLVECFNNNFVGVFEALAKSYNTRFRIQGYGVGPASNLSTFAHADLSEGENFVWRGYSGTRWASSSSHLLGRPVTSAETLTWLHNAVFLANPLDVKAETNYHFLNGINQFIFHGWPYTPPEVEYPGWRFYAAGVFNEKNPWWVVMPDMNKYLQRVSFMLRQGQPANDVALYLSEEDAYTNFRPGSTTMASSSGGFVTQSLSQRSNEITQLLDSGYNFDFLDDGILNKRGQPGGGTLNFGDVKYKVVVLPNVQRIPLATLQKFEKFANEGGILIALGSIPSLAPGYLATDADHQAIRDISARLFQGPDTKGIYLPESSELSPTLIRKLRPDVSYATATPDVGYVHRHTDGGEVYFFANTSNEPRTVGSVIRVTGLNPEWWNPVTGQISAAKVDQRYSDATAVTVELPPYGSQLLVFTNRTLPAPATAGAVPAAMDLSKGWQVTYKNATGQADPAAGQVDVPNSWIDDPAKLNFSGTATYVKQITVPAAMLQPGLTVKLDFGMGVANGASGGRGGTRMQAGYSPPVREGAAVFVNGQRTGGVWCPPYSVDVTKFLKPGANDITIVVGNLAANAMAAHDVDTQQARAAFGNRFDPQGMNLIQPMPSGILAPVQLVASPAN